MYLFLISLKLSYDNNFNDIFFAEKLILFYGDIQFFSTSLISFVNLSGE